MDGFCFEISCNIGLPISPRPATTSLLDKSGNLVFTPKLTNVF